MDAVDQFDFDLDIDDRVHLYDYTTCSLLRRSENGTWDKENFKGLGMKRNVPSNDVTACTRISLLDNAIALRSYFEETKTEDGNAVDGAHGCLATEDIVLPRRVLPVYKPGETVRGTLILKLNKPVAAESLYLTFRGYTYVNIRTRSMLGHSDARHKEIYVDKKVVFWEKEKNHSINEKNKLGAMENKTSGNNNFPNQSSDLSPGIHRFPFSFDIPSDAKRSTPPLIWSDESRALIVYRLRAVIEKDKDYPGCNLNSHKGIWVETPSDLAMDPANSLPISKEDTFNTGLPWNQGKIRAVATVTRKGILIGETVSLTLDVSNQSNGLIDAIESSITMAGSCRVVACPLAPPYMVNIASKKQVLNESIDPDQNKTFQINIPWDFSDSPIDGNLLPAGKLEDCSLLSVNYDVTVTLVRKGLRMNFTLKVPINVGNLKTKDTDEGLVSSNVFYVNED